MNEMARIRLADAVTNLREELRQAIAARKDDDILLRVGQVELELTVTAEEESGGTGKVGWWVLSGSIDLKNKASNTHKVKITLTPHTTQDHPIDIDRRSGGLD